jgi:hypothetical protein
MKTSTHIQHLLNFVIFMSLLGLTSCEKYANGPEIGWLTGSSISCNYSSGVISGFSANVKFKVTDNTSGEIKMTAEYEGEGKSCTDFVEAGKEYKAVVPCSISSTQKDSAVIVDCPTAPKPFKISTDVRTSVLNISKKEL